MILKKPNKRKTFSRPYYLISLLNCLGKVLEKRVQRRLALLTVDTIPKQQFGKRKGLSIADTPAK